MRILVLAALLAAVIPWANAQRAGAAPARFAASPHPATSFHSALHRGAGASTFARFREFGRARPDQFSPYSLGLFPDSFYPDGPVPSPDSPGVQPEFLIKMLSALNAPSQIEKPDSQSLLIELQGDRYVSLTSAEKHGGGAEPIIIPPSPEKTRERKPVTQSELLPVTLLFRDGHSENVRDYTIADGVIYARGNYYSDGYWTKKIDLLALDLRETVDSNAARGVRFVLPSSPNEVITRP